MELLVAKVRIIFHFLPLFSKIFHNFLHSTALLFSLHQGFCRHVSSGKPPPPRPRARPHMYSITSSLPCPPSHRRSFVVPHFIDHVSSITSSTTSPPSHHRSFVVHHFVPHFVDHLSSPTSSLPCHLSTLPSSIICRPSLHLPLLLHHFIDHLSSITYPPLFVTFHHSPPGLTAF